MRILLSNDDGYMACGLQQLAKALAVIADITVVAPDRNRSGCSQALTLSHPLRAKRAPNDFYYVDGNPADCVHLGITALLEEKPDLVVSGINHGENMGTDVLYSGTVGAAIEARMHGIPAIAISQQHGRDNPMHYAQSCSVIVDLVKQMAVQPLAADVVLNVNVPEQPVRGIVQTHLGERHPPKPAVATTTPFGEPVHWVGAIGERKVASEQGRASTMDFSALNEGLVSVTPIKVDLTHDKQYQMVNQWISGLDLSKQH